MAFLLITIMGNALEFILKLTDMLTPGMRTAASATDSAAGRIVADLDKVKATTASISSTNFGTKMASELNAPINKVRELGSELDKVKSKASGSGGGGLLSGLSGGMGMGGLLLGGGIAAGAAALVSGIKASISASNEAEMSKVSYSTLLGSKQKGAAMFADLNKFGNDTVFDNQDVYKNANTLLAFGMAGQKILPTMKMLGDVSMGNADHMNSLTLAFAQTQSAGRLMGQDLLQYVNAGFNPLNEISKMTGISMGELKDKMEKGAISADMVTAAFQHATSAGGMFYNSLANAADTTTGKMGILQGNISTTMIAIGDAFKPIVNATLDFVNNMFAGIDFVTKIKDGIASLLNPTSTWGYYIDQVKKYVGIVWDGISHVVGAIWHVVSGVIEWGAKSQMVRDLFAGIADVAGVLWTVIKAVADVVVWIYDHVLKPVLDAIEWVYDKVKSLLGFASSKPIEIVGSIQPMNSALQQTLVPGGLSFGQKSAAPLLPGMAGANNAAKTVTPVTANAGGAFAGLYNKGSKEGKEKADSINSGGQRSIVINIGKQIEKLEVHVMDAKEGINEIESMVREAMRRIAYSMNGVAAN